MNRVQKWLYLHCQIDFILYQLEELARYGPRSPIEAMIDQACGVEEENRKAAIRILKRLVPLFGQWAIVDEAESVKFVEGTKRTIAALQEKDRIDATKGGGK